jgi:hypothetical protein
MTAAAIAATRTRPYHAGVKPCTPTPVGDSPDDLVVRVDAALYELCGLVQDGAVAACGLGLVEGGVGGEQRFVVRLRARIKNAPPMLMVA